MSMSVGPADSSEDAPMADINTTPLVDIMLVLLIIFLITVPVIQQTVKVELPKAANIPTQTKPENIAISVDAEGNVYWNSMAVPNRRALLDLIIKEAVKVPQPEVHIRADVTTRYEAVGKVIYALQQGSIQKVGFITEPDRGIRGFR
jgi:biopolymer transport protein ExbD